MASDAKICLLLSGGIESSVLLEQSLNQGHSVQPIYLKSGLIWEKAEQYWIQKLLKHFSQPSLKPLKAFSLPFKDFFPEHWGFHPALVPKKNASPSSIYIPARNLALLSHALLFCHLLELEEIWLGSLRANSFLDASFQFYKDFEKIGKKSLPRKIKIQAPLIHLRKKQVIHRHPEFPYQLTFSCMHPKERLHCGECFKCGSRRKNFLKARVDDPTEYFKS